MTLFIRFIPCNSWFHCFFHAIREFIVFILCNSWNPCYYSMQFMSSFIYYMQFTSSLFGAMSSIFFSYNAIILFLFLIVIISSTLMSSIKFSHLTQIFLMRFFFYLLLFFCFSEQFSQTKIQHAILSFTFGATFRRIFLIHPSLWRRRRRKV